MCYQPIVSYELQCNKKYIRKEVIIYTSLEKNNLRHLCLFINFLR